MTERLDVEISDASLEVASASRPRFLLGSL
jgi:hypothetical protein